RVVDSDQDDIRVGRLEEQPVFRVQREADGAARVLVVTCDLLRIEPVHRAADEDPQQHRDDRAVCVPVADEAAQGWRDHSARLSRLCHHRAEMTVRCGIAGWIDRSLIDSRLFYPMAVKTSEDRLAFYATQVSMAEADTTYYGIPKPEVTERWRRGRRQASFSTSSRSRSSPTTPRGP